MDKLGSLLEERMNIVFEKHGHPMRLVRMESLFWFSPGDGKPAIRADQIAKDAANLYADVHSQSRLRDVGTIRLRDWFHFHLA